MESMTPYWMALAHAKNISTKRKIHFLIECVHEKLTLEEAINAVKIGDRLGFPFSESEWNGMQEAALSIPNYSFLAEKMQEHGIHTVHIMDKHVYPRSLKDNLKNEAPILIYGKGNMDLLKGESIAIVGSRDCNQISLDFTDTIAKYAVRSNKIVVSGFAKGIDKQALDSALRYEGQSIVVLPQGIETYQSKAYYKEIVKGNVLIISIYHPQAPWSVGLAMDRNKIIYGLAHQIYAAESGDKGGTWEGVLNGLKRGRKIFVRMPDKSEKNANLLLISKGATPVDMEGNVVDAPIETIARDELASYNKSKAEEASRDNVVDRLIKVLRERKGQGMTTREIQKALNLDDKTTKKLSALLKNSKDIVKQKKGRNNVYKLREFAAEQGNLFK